MELCSLVYNIIVSHLIWLLNLKKTKEDLSGSGKQPL